MSISSDDVYAIARLARLRINDDEVEHYATNLSNILDLVAEMNEVDTASIEPMAHPQDVSLRLRNDAVTEQNQREALMEIAPATEQGLYLVPRVVE